MGSDGCCDRGDLFQVETDIEIESLTCSNLQYKLRRWICMQDNTRVDMRRYWNKFIDEETL